MNEQNKYQPPIQTFFSKFNGNENIEWQLNFAAKVLFFIGAFLFGLFIIFGLVLSVESTQVYGNYYRDEFSFLIFMSYLFYGLGAFIGSWVTSILLKAISKIIKLLK